MLKIMVVDDSSVIRDKICRVLEDEQFELVGNAKNGLEAVKQFKELKPQAMTLDITMPFMDGIETILEIMSMDEDVRILVVSALADKATLIKAIQLGASGFLCKPFSDADLSEALEELLEDLIDE